MTCVGGLTLKQWNPDSFQSPSAAVKTSQARHVWLPKSRYIPSVSPCVTAGCGKSQFASHIGWNWKCWNFFEWTLSVHLDVCGVRHILCNIVNKHVFYITSFMICKSIFMLIISHFFVGAVLASSVGPWAWREADQRQRSGEWSLWLYNIFISHVTAVLLISLMWFHMQ